MNTYVEPKISKAKQLPVIFFYLFLFYMEIVWPFFSSKKPPPLTAARCLCWDFSSHFVISIVTDIITTHNFVVQYFKTILGCCREFKAEFFCIYSIRNQMREWCWLRRLSGSWEISDLAYPGRPKAECARYYIKYTNIWFNISCA